MIADITDTTVICPAVTDAAALGAALQAAWCERYPNASLEGLCTRLVQLDEGSRADPEPERVAAYEQAYTRYCQALTDHYY